MNDDYEDMPPELGCLLIIGFILLVAWLSS